MQFEGVHREIPLRGIERSAANGIAPDGAMNEVIGMIPRNGSLVPYAPTDRGLNKANDIKMIRIHHTSTGDNVIIVRAENTLLEDGAHIGLSEIITNKKEIFYNNGYCSGYVTRTISETDARAKDLRHVRDLVFIGNRMDVLTDEGIEHYLWKNGKYENIDDLSDFASTSRAFALPSIDFKVRAGIFTGSERHDFAEYVRIEKPPYDADSRHENKDKMTTYVREAKYMDSDALALMASIRNMGGITGYVLVAAAYLLKESSGDGQKYILATPPQLMGCPEIYQKDGVLRLADNKSDTKLPTDKQYMIDVFNYVSVVSSNTDNLTTATSARRHLTDNSYYSQERAFNNLWNKTENTEAADENSFADISLLSNRATTLRVMGDKSVSGYYTEGDRLFIPASSVSDIRQPLLYGCKYAVYNHPSNTGTNDSDAEHRGYRITRGTGNILSFRINSTIQKKYQDEIQSLVLFMSPIISPYKTNGTGGIQMKSTLKSKKSSNDGFFFDGASCAWNYKARHSACGGGFMPEMRSASEILSEIRNISGLYPIKTIDFNEIVKGDWVDIDLSGGKIDTVSLVQDDDRMLKVEDMRPIEILKGEIFGYNERLHIYNYTKATIYRPNYSPLCYYGGEGQYTASAQSEMIYHYAIEVRDKNDSLLVTTFDSDKPVINPMISYPDGEASTITVVKYYQHGNEYYVGRKTFQANEFASLASCYISSDLKPIDIPVKSVGMREYSMAVSEEQIMPDSQAYGKNEIRVSDVGAITMPAQNTYKIGHGEIIALARFTMGVSQDNCGRFPLVVFSTDGIYTMEVDVSGDGVYTTQSPPVSRVICTNKNGICEVDGAVVFPSEYGLMMLTQEGVRAIAPNINGAPNNTPDPQRGLGIYKNAISHKKIVRLSQSISYEDFVEYIQTKSAVIRFLHPINSLLIYNPNCSYAYLLDLQGFICTKVEQQIMFDDNDFPKQTFYIKPQKEIHIFKSVEKDGVQTVADITDLQKEINKEGLLEQHFAAEIQANITTKLGDMADKIRDYQAVIDGIGTFDSNGIPQTGSAKEYYDTADSVFIEAGTTKSDVIAGLIQEREESLNALEQANAELSAFNNALTTDYTSTTLTQEEEDVLASVGIKSVGAMLQLEKDKKANYNSLRQELVLAAQKDTIAQADASRMLRRMPIGRTVLTKQADGTWKYGKNNLSTEMVAASGLAPAQNADAGDKYTIITDNDDYTAVQFDYYTGRENIQCLLQSRPIKLDTTQLKTAYRVVMRGSFEKTNDDTVITSESGNRFNITNTAALAKFCNGEDITLNYRRRERITYHTNKAGTTIERKTYSWQWETEDGVRVKLKDIGLEQAGSITEEDTILIAPKIHYAGLYVFGSLDGNHWTLLGAEEKLLSSNRFHDIGCRTHRVSVRYLMLVFAATLSTDSHIDGLEIVSDEKYNNKLK